MTASIDDTRARSFPWYGWIGLISMLTAEGLVWQGNRWVAQWFTPIQWTGYILAADALAHRLGGVAWLMRRRREFPLLAILSVGVWLAFEVYNFRLRNWFYQGLPAEALVRDLGYFWSFATIMPGVFVTAEVIRVLLGRADAGKRRAPGGRLGPGWLWFILGAAMVTVPIALPEAVGAYLFGSVWIGFVLLVDPVNERIGAPSLRRQWQDGERRPAISLLLAGFVCGLLWEAWNYQAYLAHGAYWIYSIPQGLRPLGLHVGQMPLLGFLGFPPFALELYVMYGFLREMLGGERVFDPHATGGTLLRA